MDPQKVVGYLNDENHEFTFLIMKINQLQKLTRKIFPYLDPSLARYCQIANISKNKLVILVANGSVATQLRYQTLDLLKKFNLDPELKHILQIECKVQPTLIQPLSYSRSRLNKKMQAISPQIAEIIHHMAEQIDDKALREVMERIANRTSDAQS